ncbi:MAG: hypothetical protein AAGB11_10155 [Pseudomonadota bacterium]
MEESTFEHFLDALRAFESGWDRARYDQGIIAEWQLDQWAGGPVDDFFPQYNTWGDLSDAEWDAMSYRSMNTLGFVGYQFGEALLIDLGYYDDDFFYGNGAASNTWDGTWTGKNGAVSLESFMTAEVQERAIRDAFGFNLKVIENGLSQSGKSLDDFIGQTASYIQNGQTVTVELTLTGILAAAHLRGAYGTLALLQNGAVSTDEFGTSILRYVDQFGGFDAPTAQQLIADHIAGLTGDEGLGTPGDGGTPGGGSNGGGGNDGGGGAPSGGQGTAGVDATTADIVITWSYGKDTVSPFDPASDTIFVDWISSDFLTVSETADGVVFAVPSNNQSTTLSGVTLDDLSADNFTFLDQSAADEVLALVTGELGSGETDPDPGPDPGDDNSDDGTGNPDGEENPDDGSTGSGGGGAGDDSPPDNDPDPTVVAITWDWASRKIIRDFDPSSDIIDFGSVGGSQLRLVSRADGDVVVKVLGNGNQLYRFDGVTAADLSADNFTAAQWNTSAVPSALSDLDLLV